MKEIITALANPKLNNKLKEINEFNISYNDIQYQDGVLEILKENTNIEILILSEILPGELKIKEFIYEIKKYNKNIKIIIFLEKKKEDLEYFLRSEGIFDIYYNNEISENKIIEKIEIKSENNWKLEKIKNIINENIKTNEMKNRKKELLNIKNKLKIKLNEVIKFNYLIIIRIINILNIFNFKNKIKYKPTDNKNLISNKTIKIENNKIITINGLPRSWKKCFYN